ncbi:DUF2804 domain-containing protein [Lujinxingia sediminis]|uniref:DUF2804 domain-containing protein n=1 Tax=Lujinxingia sediminis TaxID=2480984 RepID=A0ABY0CSN0_9DELT|nr:DUF2804 domain-containing protein [Lujinxingia sediminis]RVU43187.1 DUF2804 domain-containing protein [Lujinxingia sediminis]
MVETVHNERLEKVPNAMVDRLGAARIGTYRGELSAVQLDRLRGAEGLEGAAALMRRKRWQYSAICTDEIFIAQAIVHAGYAAHTFMYAVDLLEERPVLRFGGLGVPGLQVEVGDRPGVGLAAHYRRPGAHLYTRREPRGAPYEMGGRLGAWAAPASGKTDFRAELHTRGAAPALTVISPVPAPGRINVTQKWTALPVKGHLKVGSRSYRLDGGLGALDYTQGYLGRQTAWRWAMGMGRLPDGRRLGLNLVEGFNDTHPTANENALWVGEELIGLGRARFAFEKNHPERPWEVQTTCGRVRLGFRSIFVHREVRNLGPVRSYFIQPAGVFEGEVRVGSTSYAVRLVGVTEDQDIWW